MKNTAAIRVMILLALTLGLLAGCEGSSDEGSGSVNFPSNLGAVLPPGHPGYLEGTLLVLPVEDQAPAIHAANCFAGVPDPGDFGIGSSVGYTRETALMAVLPVNINLGGTTYLDGYTVHVTVSSPAIQIDLAHIAGSYAWLADGDCRDRGCPSGCLDAPKLFPDNEFLAARGFEDSPTAIGDGDSVTVSATNDFPLTPVTGTVNLFNLPIRFVGDLPLAGVTVTFTVTGLTTTGDPLTVNPISGIVIKNFQLR